MDIVGILLAMINVQAAMIGVAAAQAWAYFTPAKEGGEPLRNTFLTTKGGWMARVAPLIAPVVAAIATVVLEWDAAFVSIDAARGILSGFASEFMLRLWYKTIRGL